MMSSWDEYMSGYYGGSSTTPSVPSSRSRSVEPVFSDDALSKDDLKQQQYLNSIRDYMIDRKGVDYRDLDADTVVDDFVQHMRYFNANTFSTATEARFISRADDTKKDNARKAYTIYDNLGNVFQNDGVFGAVDGVKDYVFAAAKDPTNYIGLLTGGVGRAAAAGVSITGKKTVREAVKRAAQEAALGGAGREAAKQAGIKAGEIAAKRSIARGASSKAADKAADQVAQRVAKENRRAMAKKAANAKQKELFETNATKSLYATTAIDSSFAVMNDVMAQNTLLSAGSQEKYSLLQTGFSSLLGGVAGAAQLGFGKFRGASNLAEDVDDKLSNITNLIIEDAAPILSKGATKEAEEVFIKKSQDWVDKVAAGSLMSAERMPASLVRSIVFGDGGEEVGGLAKIFKDNNIKFTRKTTISDVMTNVVRNMDDDAIENINKKLEIAGFTIGDLAGSQARASDLLAGKISDAASTMNVMSQLRRTVDTTIVAAQDAIEATLNSTESKEAIGQELKRAEALRYGQSVWKRMLVSSTSTTAVNVFGFGQFYMGQTLADIANSGLLGAKGLAQMYTNPKEATKTFRQMRALTMIQGQKMRNLLDPYTTHDAYMKFLDQNKDIKKILFETYSGSGVESGPNRFGINADGTAVKWTEAVANASARISGVKVQDSFTKSQMFMTEMDKYLRMNKDTTLAKALNDDSIEIGEDVIQAALDGTLKSVYAKDYTTDDQLLKGVAKLVEGISNTPGLGFILPFGRFMNNVVATSYQWSPLATMTVAKDFAKRTKKLGGTGKAISMTEQETIGRLMVGTGAYGAAIAYDKERQKKGLGIFEVDAGKGTIIDAKNTFPLSIFLAVGRAANLRMSGQEVPKEIITESLLQLGVGQVAKDVQFGNDLMAVADTIMNFDEGQRGRSSDAIYKALGNVTAGVTRPVDAVNKLWGFVAGNDIAKDVRQAEGMNIFTQSASKYVDNILETLVDKISDTPAEALTGTELRVGQRDGQVYDPDPLARMFGLNIKQGRTATEKAYSMGDMFQWTASERTKIPEYDRIFNSFLAPILEREITSLLRHRAYIDGDSTDKREMLRTKVSNVKSHIRKRMRKGYMGGDASRLALVAKIEGTKKKSVRRKAMEMAKEQFGIEGAVEDLTHRELGILTDYIDYLEDIYDEVGKL